jgi:hypothetical protein
METLDYNYTTMLQYAMCVPGPAALIRKQALEFVNGRNPNYRYVTDIDFWFRLGLHGDLARIPQILATHRAHSGSSGVAQRAKVGEELVKYIEDFFSTSDLPSHIQKLYAYALSSAYFHAGVRASDYRTRRRYFIKSFRRYPLSWVIHRNRRALWVWGALLLPAPIYNILRPPFAALYTLLGKKTRLSK